MGHILFEKNTIRLYTSQGHEEKLQKQAEDLYVDGLGRASHGFTVTNPTSRPIPVVMPMRTWYTYVVAEVVVSQ
jgi:hypothetical protein